MSAETADLILRAATSADVAQLGRLGALLVETHHAFDAKRLLPITDRTPSDYGPSSRGSLRIRTMSERARTTTSYFRIMSPRLR